MGIHRTIIPTLFMILSATNGALSQNVSNQKLDSLHPKEELTTGSLDLTANYINAVHHYYPAFNGSSIRISIKEQNFDTSDIDIKNRHFISGFESPTSSSHAAIMATAIVGGGNTSELAKGVAWGSSITNSDFAHLLPEPDTFSELRDICAKCFYGTDLNDYYGPDAAAYDLSAISNQTLVYVFSSGNTGVLSSTSGIYQSIPGFNNLMGSFKMAKNAITVGATDSLFQVAPLSSRGPANDGRIKPELVAFGEDGTSGAAALASGTSALLQQVYKADHLDLLPSSALIKATLVNSAFRKLNQSISYSIGFGNLNALDAIKTIIDRRYQSGSLSTNDSFVYHVIVPASAAKLKVTLAWIDTPSTVNSSKALVNDLDLSVRINNQTWLPWVLSPYPNADSLQLPAIRKVDTLNNIEQVTLDFPSAGDYTIKVVGRDIKTKVEQAFSVVYQVDTLNQFIWTYPTASDHLLSGATAFIRWKTSDTGKISIEYSINNQPWKVLGVANKEDQYIKWIIPDLFGSVQFRINNGQFIYSDTITISNQPAIKVGFDCPDSFLLHWSPFPSTTYQLYYLGDQYMVPFKNISDTDIIIRKNASPSDYYAVEPVSNGKTASRSFTINYKLQAAGCYINNFFAALVDQHAQLDLQLGSLYNVSTITFQKLINTQIIDLYTIHNADSAEYLRDDLQLTRGINRYQVKLVLVTGQTIYSTIESIYYYPDQPILIYPNPVSQYSSINIAVQDQGIYTARIIDLYGRVLLTMELDDLIQQIPLTKISKGMYLIQIKKGQDRLFIQKLVVY